MFYKKHKKIFVLKISSSFLGALVLLMFVFSPSVSAIPNFYNTDKTKACNSGDTKLITPYINEEKSYYCASGLETEYITPADRNGTCPPGVPMIGGGAVLSNNFCLVHLDIVTVNGQPINGQLGIDCKDKNLSKNCGIVRYLRIFINTLSGLVGVVVVIMIIVGGIQYSSAGGDPQKVAAAKSKITNALLALLIFIFMYAFLQWVVPGGVF